MIMSARARLSANAVTRWARHLLFDHCELFRIHHARRIYPAIAFAGHTFETVIAVWVVPWHLVAPVLMVLFLAATFRVRRSGQHTYLSDADDVMVSLVASMPPIFDQRYWDIHMISSHPERCRWYSWQPPTLLSG